MYPDKLPGVDVHGATGYMNTLRRGAVSTVPSQFAKRPLVKQVLVADNALGFDPKVDEMPTEHYEHNPHMDLIPEDVANELNAAAADFETTSKALGKAASANAICVAATTLRKARR